MSKKTGSTQPMTANKTVAGKNQPKVPEKKGWNA
jgi:hypothetical protein